MKAKATMLNHKTNKDTNDNKSPPIRNLQFWMATHSFPPVFYGQEFGLNAASGSFFPPYATYGFDGRGGFNSRARFLPLRPRQFVNAVGRREVPLLRQDELGGADIEYQRVGQLIEQQLGQPYGGFGEQFLRQNQFTEVPTGRLKSRYAY